MALYPVGQAPAATVQSNDPLATQSFVTNATNTSAGIITVGGFQLGLAITFTYSGGFAYITSPAIARIQIGALDAAAPVAQTLSVQSVVTGTTNTAGTNFTITGSQGTGTGIGGDIIFQVAPASTTGSTPNTLVQALRVYNNKTVIVGSNYTVATLPTAGTQGRRAWVTDATAPTFGGALTGGGAVVIPVFDNGTAWVSA